MTEEKTKIERLGEALLLTLVDLDGLSRYARNNRGLPGDAKELREMGKRVAILTLRMATELENGGGIAGGLRGEEPNHPAVKSVAAEEKADSGERNSPEDFQKPVECCAQFRGPSGFLPFFQALLQRVFKLKHEVA